MSVEIITWQCRKSIPIQRTQRLLGLMEFYILDCKNHALLFNHKILGNEQNKTG